MINVLKGWCTIVTICPKHKDCIGQLYVRVVEPTANPLFLALKSTAVKRSNNNLVTGAKQ
jgi:hypothetical protein